MLARLMLLMSAEDGLLEDNNSNELKVVRVLTRGDKETQEEDQEEDEGMGYVSYVWWWRFSYQTEVELYMEVVGAPELDLFKHDLFHHDLKLSSVLQQLEWSRGDVQVCR